ncbi:uncharacterized protein LOC108718309 [Xenopus laevis]|uniref:C-type lectin domain-containing protein n=2 Tax=Xenopus laevis TaxID=8355 RepID=A0A974HIT4_XENLA|nr:uncharacterized protein LOC108718309 [Xenopus laevis]OCT79141.1 hypothetical protein XELAEV_18030239mg [Xenopus laevis]
MAPDPTQSFLPRDANNSSSTDPTLLADPRGEDEELVITCPVLPGGSAHYTARDRTQEPNCTTAIGHLGTTGNHGNGCLWHWILKHKWWLIITAIVGIIIIIIGLVFLIKKAGRNSTEPPNTGGTLIWQNCSGIQLNISTVEVSWEEANSNCTKYRGQLIDKSEIDNDCIGSYEDFWIKQENTQSEKCEVYNMNYPNLTLHCDSRRRYICSKS